MPDGWRAGRDGPDGRGVRLGRQAGVGRVLRGGVGDRRDPRVVRARMRRMRVVVEHRRVMGPRRVAVRGRVGLTRRPLRLGLRSRGRRGLLGPPSVGADGQGGGQREQQQPAHAQQLGGGERGEALLGEEGDQQEPKDERGPQGQVERCASGQGEASCHRAPESFRCRSAGRARAESVACIRVACSSGVGGRCVGCIIRFERVKGKSGTRRFRAADGSGRADRGKARP
jgi:hypothetical protein